MFELYQIIPDCSIPIYQQLADRIRSRAAAGELRPGDQLPTVRELSDALGIARGTVKRAYDELEKTQTVEKVQGRGTFIRYQPSASESRKERAMAAIDTMFSELEDMNFTLSEIRIFLDLKLRQRADIQSKLKVAVVECNPEVLSQLAEQLRSIDGLEITCHLLDEVAAYPYRLGEEADLVVTTTEHAAQLEKLISQRGKIAKVALRLKPKCVAQIVKLQAGEVCGLLCASHRFGQLLDGFLRSYTQDLNLSEPQLFDDTEDIDGFLLKKTVLLVPDGYEKFCSGALQKKLTAFARTNPLIACAYQIDEGSMIYLQEHIERLMERKRL